MLIASPSEVDESSESSKTCDCTVHCRWPFFHAILQPRNMIRKQDLTVFFFYFFCRYRHQFGKAASYRISGSVEKVIVRPSVTPSFISAARFQQVTVTDYIFFHDANVFFSFFYKFQQLNEHPQRLVIASYLPGVVHSTRSQQKSLDLDR